MSRKLNMDELQRMSVEQFATAHKQPLTIVLDNVRSLNNIGSVFRTADAFRIERICLCGITATPPHRDIHKTALGAEDAVAWHYFPTTKECVESLRQQGCTIVAVEQIDDSVKMHQWQATLHAGESLALIMGNEINGVSDDVLPLCDFSIEIPQFGTKHSLNISCAAAIVMWEFSRQNILRN